MKITFLLSPLIILGLVGIAYAHTVDSVDEYRLEIGWMNEPVVSKETNAIELHVSPLKKGVELKDQVFENGVIGLEKSLKIQLVLKDHKITLPLEADHNIPGKYYAFVNPTVSGFYQANILGKIGNTTVSLSMHPPKVDERAYIEFPEPTDVTLNQIINSHTTIVGDINRLKESVSNIEQLSYQANLGLAGIGLGIAGIAIASIALAKSRRQS